MIIGTYGALYLLIAYLVCMVLFVQLKQDDSLGNFTWGGGCIVLTLYTFFIMSTRAPRQIIVTSLIVLWGVRLIIYLYSRYKRGADPRFVTWQRRWGFWSLFLSIGWIFFLQGALLLVMSYPSVWVNITVNPPLNALDLCGVALWALGFFFESVSDYQLYAFMQDPSNKGHVMKKGLWKYSRHPNYFGEIAMWWGIYLLALSVPYGYLTIIAPLTITVLLVYVTGIPWVERALEANREYQDYRDKTSILIPWWPEE